MTKTLEEVAEKLFPPRITWIKSFEKVEMNAFIAGAKWQQERSYSEEEVLKLLKDYDRLFKLDTFAYTKPCTFTVKEWFEQFKKK